MSEFPTIPGLQITGLLGRGGMAAVYSARQLALGREVAVKLVRPEGPAAAQQLQRLEHEAQSLAGLQHPNIVELYDFGRSGDGAMYYVMPLLTGGDLTRWPKPAEAAAVRRLLEALLDALEHAHGAGVVHRDLKPENILFDRNGRPLLADFGAALQRNRSRLTEEGIAIGSTGYMSPEQTRADSLDGRSDLYSLAVVGFELLTGQLPFDGPDALAVALAQHEKPVPTLPARLQHWQGFFDAALAVDRQQRPASAAAMRRALQQVGEGPSPAHMQRRYQGWGLGLGVLALVLFALLFWLGRGAPPGRAEIEAQIAAGQLLPPAPGSALELLQDAASAGLPEADQAQLSAALFEALAVRLRVPLQQGDLDALRPLWIDWQRAVASLRGEDIAVVIALHDEVEVALSAQLQQALSGFDRSAADSALALLDATARLSKPLLDLAAQVRALPAVGERFREGPGVELVLARRPDAEAPGLAVMASAVSVELYRAYLEAGKRAPRECALREDGLQACLDRSDAQALAEWLSAATGERYRLPDRHELSALIGHVAAAELRAWTNSCRELRVMRRPNAAQRAWGGVRSLFGGEAAQGKVETRCEGYFTLALDGRGGEAEPRVTAGPDTGVVLLRELPAKR